MRKAILSLVVVFAVASVASAIPTGPGGTFYINSIDTTNKVQKLYRINVDSDWNPVYDDGTALVPGANDGVLNYANIADDMIKTTAGMRSIWYHPVSGKLDMNGSYNDASVLLGAYYNNTNCGSFGNGSLRGSDILEVRPDASVTILHDGVDSGSGDKTNPHTTEHFWQTTVDDGFTPNGEATGFANLGRYTSAVWEDNGDGESGYCANGVRPTHFMGAGYNSNSSQSAYAPCGANSYIDDGATAVIGLLVTNLGSSLTASSHHTYMTAAGNYVHVTGSSDDPDPATYYHYSRNNTCMAMGDTNNDGVLDAYWVGLTPENNYHVVHATDLNSDGDWMDFGETWNPNIGYLRAPEMMELIQCSSGLWALVALDDGGDKLWVWGLDSDGNWDGTPRKTILEVADDTSMGLLSPVSGDRGAFAPLGEAIPEPATMMLVGTGLLSLVGIIRRRRLS